jgi:hypothetical protein
MTGRHLLRAAVLCTAAVLATAAAGAAQAQTRIESVRVGVGEVADAQAAGARTRVVFDLSGAPRYTLFRLSDPQRVVIDVADAALADAPAASAFAGSRVLRLRSGERGGGTLRLVLDLAEGDVSVRDFTLRPDRDSGRGHRLVVDLLPRGAEEQAVEQVVAAAATGASLDAGAESVETLPTPTVAASEAPAAAPAPRAAASAEQAAPAPRPAPRRSEPAVSVDFSGTWQHEWAWATQGSESQKFESIVQPRWDVSLANGLDLTAILRVRGDAVGDLGPTERRPPNYSDASAPWFSSGEAELSLRELYVDFRWGEADWRLGKQQVVWGQADGIKVLDVVNPQSFREFILDDFDDSRIPLWMANVSLPVGDAASLQLLWIPDTTYHELAELGTPFAFTTPRIVPAVPITGLAEADKPDDPLADSDAGFALSGFVGGWDLSLNYLYRTLDAPVLPVRVRGPGLFRLEPEYRRSHLLGGTFSNAFGDVTLRGELAYNSDTFQPTDTLLDDAIAESAELSAVIGLDWALSMDTLLSAQFFNSTLFDHVDAMGRDEHEQLLTLLYQQDFANATWRVRGIGIHSVNDGDSQLQLRLSYWVSSALEVWVGADAFSGNRRGLFGQFDDNDRAVVGFEYGF